MKALSFSSHVTVWGFVLLGRLKEFGFRRAFRNCFRTFFGDHEGTERYEQVFVLRFEF